MNKKPKALIKEVTGREIFDSRGNPTIEVEIILEPGFCSRMMVPAGASTGIFEAAELRDNDKRFRGKGVSKAVGNVNGELRKLLIGKDASEQEFIDELLIEVDGSPNKSRIGANAITGVSLAVARAAAMAAGKAFYRYIADKYLQPEYTELFVPVPMVNIISGGMHAGRNIDAQDFLIIPVGASSYREALEMISNVYWTTRDLLNKKGYNAYLLADEGGFGPQLSSNREALDILAEVFSMCGYAGGRDMVIALDIAASTFYDADKKLYHLASEKKWFSSGELVDMLEKWTKDYPVVSIEDGLAQDDWEGWQLLTKKLGSGIQLIGDDLFVTNSERIKKGIALQAGNAVLIKMNQVGTLTETVHAVNTARQAGYETIISARSGETEDDTIADLAVGLNASQIKIGSFAGSSRLAKYNQLTRISELKGVGYGYASLSFGQQVSRIDNRIE
jgi:enolase